MPKSAARCWRARDLPAACAAAAGAEGRRGAARRAHRQGRAGRDRLERLLRNSGDTALSAIGEREAVKRADADYAAELS